MYSASDCNKLNVILDIDETLVYFINKRFFKHSWDLLSEEEKSKYTVHPNNSGIFIVRPHLNKFLTFLFKHCNVSLWTLSDKEYAEGVAKQFVLGKSPTRTLQHIFNADEHADAASDLHGNNKDLNWLWYHSDFKCFAECNTILIDDLPKNTMNPSNRKNAITINPFALFGEVKDRSKPYTDVSQDDTLLNIMEVLKKVMKHQNKCMAGDGRWDNVFSEPNVQAMGLGQLLHLKKYQGKEVKAFCVGDHSHIGSSSRGGRARR